MKRQCVKTSRKTDLDFVQGPWPPFQASPPSGCFGDLSPQKSPRAAVCQVRRLSAGRPLVLQEVEGRGQGHAKAVAQYMF